MGLAIGTYIVDWCMDGRSSALVEIIGGSSDKGGYV